MSRVALPNSSSTPSGLVIADIAVSVRCQGSRSKSITVPQLAKIRQSSSSSTSAAPCRFRWKSRGRCSEMPRVLLFLRCFKVIVIRPTIAFVPSCVFTCTSPPDAADTVVDIFSAD